MKSFNLFIDNNVELYYIIIYLCNEKKMDYLKILIFKMKMI